jgi:hypothetical protein
VAGSSSPSAWKPTRIAVNGGNSPDFGQQHGIVLVLWPSPAWWTGVRRYIENPAPFRRRRHGVDPREGGAARHDGRPSQIDLLHDQDGTQQPRPGASADNCRQNAGYHKRDEQVRHEL